MNQSKYIVASDYHQIWCDQLKHRYENPVPKLSTGITIMDDKLGGGLTQGQICVIGGLPGCGKTSFTLQVAHHMAVLGRKVLLYNYEMRPEDLHERIVARANHVVLSHIQEGGVLTQEDLDKAMFAPVGLENILYCDADSSLNLDKIYDHMITINNGNSIMESSPVVVIDYLQKLPPLKEEKNRDFRLQIEQNLNTLREITKQTGCIMIVISSLNREAGKQGEIDMSSFKESGNVEYDADVLLGMGSAKFVESKDDKGVFNTEWQMVGIKELHDTRESQGIEQKVKFNVLKARKQFEGSFVLNFNRMYQYFETYYGNGITETSMAALMRRN